jgi:spore coat polysaccharide biosynthesis protein SpsF (cytidylyltransferase family)
MDFLAIIQARIGSTRLPGKVLMDFEGKTVLEHVISRVQRSRMVSEVVVATTFSISDLSIVKLCSEKGVRVFCGSEDDVLDRFYQAAKLLKPENVVRITADCPLMDPDVIDKVIKKHSLEKADYTSNTLIESYPDGEDVEVFTYKALVNAWSKAELKSEREHVTPYIKKHNDMFKLVSIENEEDLSSKRWTLDNQEDFELISIVYKELYKNNNYFGMAEVLEFFKKNPELEKINNHIIRNEGYQLSLTRD